MGHTQWRQAAVLRSTCLPIRPFAPLLHLYGPVNGRSVQSVAQAHPNPPVLFSAGPRSARLRKLSVQLDRNARSNSHAFADQPHAAAAVAAPDQPLFYICSSQRHGIGTARPTLVPNTQYSVLDSQYSINTLLDTQHSILNTKYSILSTKYEILNTQIQYPIPTQYSTLNIQYPIHNHEYSIPKYCVIY